jgi:hypothetical protein
VNDCAIAQELRGVRRSHGSEQGSGTRPICCTIHGAAVAEDDRRLVVQIRDGFKLLLHVKDRPLRGSSLERPTAPRKSTREEEAGRLG